MKPSSEPLVIFGKPGSGKSVLAAKVAQFVHKWLPDSSFILRYTRLTTVSTNITSLLGSVAEQVCYLTKTTPCYGPHVNLNNFCLFYYLEIKNIFFSKN